MKDSLQHTKTQTKQNAKLKAISKKLFLVAAPFLLVVIGIVMLTHPAIEESKIHSSFKTMYDSAVVLTNGIRSNAIDDFVPVQHESWDIKETEYVPEYKINVVTYTHKKTGGELVSIHWDKSENTNPREQEKVFSIFFRTPVSDSTGVPHILEHSVLCGSKKYTTKEPFADIRQKSLNTFLNAFTWDDRTGFAFASCNTQDFWNSLGVYLDAVFKPRVRHDKYVLAQEGWHLRPTEGSAVNARRLDDTTLNDVELEYSGVVYSEMKGVYSNSDSLLYRRLQQHTFPDTGYKFDSGGDPKVIPTLTHKHFGEFYDKYYHPSNAITYVSGMDPSTGHEFLSRVDEYYKEYEAAPEKRKASIVKMQHKRFKKAFRKQYAYPVENKKDSTHMIAINFLINDKPISSVEQMAWSVLNRLLLGTSTSILYKTLSESGLGNKVLGYGLSDELVQSTFGIGLKGVKKDDVPKVERLIMDTLRKIKKDGFKDSTIESSLNFIEFHLRENESGGNPKGLDFMFASMSKYNYDYSPTEGIKFEDSLAKLKSAINKSKSKIFQDLIQNYLLNNNHRVVIDFYPSVTYEAENAKEEQDRVSKYKQSLNTNELRSVIKFAEELKTKEATPDSKEDIATIPHITLADVNRDVVDYPNKVEENVFDSGVTLVSHALPTAGILYADIGIDISKLSLKIVSEKLPLYIAFMTQTGTDKLSEVKLRESIEMHTGGIGATTLISQIRDSSNPDTIVLDGSNWASKLLIKGKSLAPKADKLFDLILTVLTESKLDKQQKAIELLKSSCASQESAVASSGNSYALTRLRARYTVGGAMSEKIGGVTSLEDSKALLKQAQEDWPSVLNDLKAIRTTLMDTKTIKDGLIINLTGDEDTLKTAQPELKKFIEKLAGDESSDSDTTSEAAPPLKNPLLAKIAGAVEDAAGIVEKAAAGHEGEQHPWLEEALETLKAKQQTPVDEALLVPTQVSYVAKGNKVYEIGEKVHGSSSVITSWLSTVYLWNTVRIQGNAYGAGANLDDSGGVFACVSYRDPNIVSTLKFYDGVVPWIREQVSEFKKNPKELESAIIGAVNEGSPPSNSQKGERAFLRYLLGHTTESRQTWKDEILNTTAVDFEEFAKRLENANDYSTVIVTSGALYESAKLPKRNVLKINAP